MILDKTNKESVSNEELAEEEFEKYLSEQVKNIKVLIRKEILFIFIGLLLATIIIASTSAVIFIGQELVSETNMVSFLCLVFLSLTILVASFIGCIFIIEKIFEIRTKYKNILYSVEESIDIRNKNFK